jgi:23S rRNA pseudouridine1911/1915/1917 synthase
MENSDSQNDSGEDDCIELIVTPEDVTEFKRLDVFLAKKIPHLSRSFLKQLFQNNQITLKLDIGKKLELKRMPIVDAIIQIQIPPPLPDKARPENIPLKILFEDDHLLIVNKAAGMVTHPAPGNWTGTLVNAVLHHCQNLTGMGDTKRPGIVHRLDKGTSGVMVVAKTRQCHEGLVLLFSSHDIVRKYECLSISTKQNKIGTLESLIGRHPNNRIKMTTQITNGKKAITHYKVINYYENLAHMELTLETGRTHQIRVHLSELLKSAILCDSVYGNPKQDLERIGKKLAHIIGTYPHPLLHAKTLGFKHPITGESIIFHAPVPEMFQQCLDYLNEHELNQ